MAGPMSNAARLAGYEKQNAGRPLSGPQLRRLARHDLKCTMDDGDTVQPKWASPWQTRFSRMHETRQHFRPVIDNSRRPTGRVGIRRFGPQLSLDGLTKLLFAPRKTGKGMDLGNNAVNSERGRMTARTAHGRRKGAGRWSSRGR